MMRHDIEDVTDLVRADGKRPNPDFEFMKQRLSRWIALGLGSGLSPVAPGTMGTLLAWALFVPLHALLGDIGMGVLTALAFGAGLWSAERCGRDLRSHDHGAIVWDEVVAFWMVLLTVPHEFGAQLLALVAFRFFDIVKPPPIRWLERRWPNGFGVMVDDVAAALYTMGLLWLWFRA